MVEWAGWMLRWAGWAKGQSPPGGAEAERSEGAVDRQDRRRAEEERREGAACTVGRVSLEEPTSPDHPGVPQGIGAWLRIEDGPLVPRTGIFISDQNPFVVPGSGPSAGQPVPLACATPRWGCQRRLPAGGGPRRC